MFLTKDGITIEVFHPSDVARYKKLGYTVPVNPQPEPVAPEPVAPEPTQQEKDQATAEAVVQPTKKGKGKS